MTASPSTSELFAMINELKAANAKLASDLASASAPKRLTCKVSDKGALSVYGLGRFPVTLYATQWERLFAASTEISAFAKANASLLATKPAVASA